MFFLKIPRNKAKGYLWSQVLTSSDQMIVNVNGIEKNVPPGRKLRDVLQNEPYVEGSMIAISRSGEKVQSETDEYEIVTKRGSFNIRLNGTVFADKWKALKDVLIGTGIRWKTNKILAIGSFPSDLAVDRERHDYQRYDCFLSLGGFDNRSTYMMIARIDHTAGYGTNDGIFGKVTKGRHLLELIEEEDPILAINPVVLDTVETNSFATNDLSQPLEDGMFIETYVHVQLNKNSPVGCEQFLVVAEKGVMTITDKTSTYSANSSRLNVSLVKEETAVRDDDVVTVRNDGAGAGRIYFYHARRQLSPNHTIIGKIINGAELMRLAPKGSNVTIRSTPQRIMTIGMTQKDAALFLESLGIKQSRTGLVDDHSIVVEQEPELTMEIAEEVETLGRQKELIAVWEINEQEAPRTALYLRKLSGLDYKKVGTLKVFFTFPGMPMITFEGNISQASSLLPEATFGELSKRGEIGVTNMSRPGRGTIGIRLEPSDEFGPTGEERPSTNLAGVMVSDLETFLKDLRDGDLVYIREVETGDEIAEHKLENQKIDEEEFNFVTHKPPAGPFV